MHAWVDLIAREVFFLALVTALGTGPAAFLPERFDSAVRLALAPALGLAAGVCLTVTLVYAFPAQDTAWLVVALALASVGLGWWRRPKPLPRLDARSVAQLAVVVIVVLGSLDYVPASQHTVGPAGGYAVADASAYVTETNGEQHTSIRDADRARPPFANLARGYWDMYASAHQQLDISALAANANALLGLGSTDTQCPFLISVLMIGALGVFGLVRYESGRPTWAAVVGACMFAGPLLVELLMDGSQAAIAGAALLAPIVVLGLEALRRPRPATLVVFALLAAGLQTVYPLFVPCLVIGGAAALAVLLARRLLRGGPLGRDLGLAALRLGGVLVLAAALTPVAFARNVRYWESILNGTLSLAGLPKYRLPFNVLPGWLLQTREFYNLVDLRHATSSELLLGAAVPVVLVAVIALGVTRHRGVLLMLAIAAGASLLAYYTWAGRDCSYCVQRNLLPVGVLAAPALGLGIATLAMLVPRASLLQARRTRLRAGPVAGLLAGIVAALTILVVGHEGVVERQRMAQSYLLDEQDRQALGALPTTSTPVEVEGFGQGPAPPMELPLAYDLVDEKTGNASIETTVDDNLGLAYLGGTQPLGPSFKPYYAFVLTRLGSIRTQRRVLARYGPIALEQRTHDLDVTLAGGVSVDGVRQDATGVAWVNPLKPLQFIVVGGTPHGQAWVSLVLRRTVPVDVLPGPDVAAAYGRGSAVHVCLRTHGYAPIRSASVQIRFAPQPPPASTVRYSYPLPPRGLALASMSVARDSCVPGRRV
jgi:hypothetical protein